MAAVSSRPVHVLLVEGDAARAQDLARRLQGASDGGDRLTVEHVGSLARALDRLDEGGVDAVLLDLLLPDSEGLVTFEEASAWAPGVPIVVLTDLDDEALAMSTVRAGAQDYLVRRRVDERLLDRSIRYAIERHRLLTASRSLSLIDDLTGLYNRRGFMELGTQFLKLARRSGRGATVLYLDLDRFKDINDAHGHHVGDRALTKVADILRAAFRRSDLIARMGGDEFAVLAPAASGEPAEALIHRVRRGIAEFGAVASEPYRLEASVGVVRTGDDESTGLAELLAGADRAMYRSKRAKQAMVAS